MLATTMAPPASVAEELALNALVRREEAILREHGKKADFGLFEDYAFEDLDGKRSWLAFATTTRFCSTGCSPTSSNSKPMSTRSPVASRSQSPFADEVQLLDTIPGSACAPRTTLWLRSAPTTQFRAPLS